MTNSTFIDHFAAESGMPKTKAREFLKALEAATKTYVQDMPAGEKIKIADVTYRVVEVPERSGTNYLTGGTWTKPAHNVVKVSIPKDFKAIADAE